MTDILIRPEINFAPRKSYVAEGPIDFGTWLCFGQDLDTELVGGVMVDRVAAQFPHEWLFAWLLTVLRSYSGKRNLGEVLGSRTAVKIHDYAGRLPDILFVRAENQAIIHRDAIYGVPDLVIEIVASNDRPADLASLESDYRLLGVPEILFIDPREKRVRVVYKNDTGFEEHSLTSGRLALQSVPGFWIEVEWLFAETRPNELDIVLQLLQEASASQP